MKLSIVVPRYGDEIVGGAETLARQLAEHLPRPEFDARILTTCTDNLGDGENIYPAGLARVNGVPVLRFPINHKARNASRFHELTARLINHTPLTVDEELEWIDNGVHSPELYAYLARHGPQYDFLIFVPYLYGTTFYGSTLWPERTIVWPCLHDELFAHFVQTRLMLETCRGVMFNSESELALARDKLKIRLPRPVVVGGGIDAYQANPDRFRRRWGLTAPFILYAGRIEFAKNVLELVSFFIEYKRLHPGPLKLVMMGEGSLSIPSHPDIIPIGFQSEQDKLDVYAAATLLVQPSLMESFSIVIMEAWLSGAPALVHGECDVTRRHIQRCNGGLYYIGLAEFMGALDWLVEHPAERKRMGELGRAYVLDTYSWPAVVERFRAALATWQQ